MSDASASHLTDIAIVGAGMVGCSLAVACLRLGLKVALIDPNPVISKMIGATPDSDVFDLQAQKINFSPRVSAISFAGQQLLFELEAWQKIPSYRLSAYQDMVVWDAEGTGRLEFHGEDVHSDHLGHIVENEVIVQSLIQTLNELVVEGNGELNFFPSQVEDYFDEAWGTLEANKTPLSRILLSDQQYIDAHLVVGADGARSTVRELAAMKTRQWDYGHKAIVSTIRTEKPHQKTAWQRFLPEGPLAFLPLTGSDDRYCSIVWSLLSPLADEHMAISDETFLQRITEASEQCLGDVQWVDQRFAFPLQQCHAKHYVKDRLVLIGDAAHSIHPLAGQGVNLGFLDVHALTIELQRAQQRGLPLGHLSVLKRYERARQGDNLKMMALMESLKRMFAADDIAVRWLRNAGMNWVNRSSWIKNFLTQQAMHKVR